MRSLCLTQRDFLGFFEGINLGGKIQSRRHAEQEPEPGHDAVAITNAHSCPALSELSRSDLVLWHDPDLTENTKEFRLLERRRPDMLAASFSYRDPKPTCKNISGTVKFSLGCKVSA